MKMGFVVISVLFFFFFAEGQFIEPQLDTWNSSYTLPPSLASEAGIDNITAHNLEIGLRFERSNWAAGSVHDDDFYSVPNDTSQLPPGTVLKVQQYVNMSSYTVPPLTALSRFVYQTENFNGSTIPASAYVLWPYNARLDPQTGKFAVVAWAHGFSGAFGECAPSHMKNLQYQFAAPFELALQGYVVVAPDYAGLGVTRGADGEEIAYSYINNPSEANDLFYAVEATQAAWGDKLSERFVVMGQSVGGGAAWGAAQRQSRKPVDGYLGTIAVSPVTNSSRMLELIPTDAVPLSLPFALKAVFPDFDVSDILTPAGIKLVTLMKQVEACGSALIALLDNITESLVRSDYLESSWMQLYANLTENGGNPISGPMLVIQGTADPGVSYRATTEGVNKTCATYPESELEYATYEGATHVPVLYASQRVWLDWIWDRFLGREVQKACKWSPRAPDWQVSTYQAETSWFLEFAKDGYETGGL